MGNTFGQKAGRQTPGLQDDNLAFSGGVLFEKNLGNLG
jgi:hypothetical protein